jgi:hypothetical protein
MMTISEPQKENLFFQAPEFNSHSIRMELPADMVKGFADITAEIEKERAAAHSKMETYFQKAQEAMVKAAPKVDLSAFTVDINQRLTDLEQQHTDAMAAVTAGLTETDCIRDVMKLQSRVIGGESLRSLTDKLNEPRQLIALADLAEQTNDNDTAQRAKDKLAHLVSGDALRDIQKLRQALKAIMITERNYNEAWGLMVGDLGIVRRY